MTNSITVDDLPPDAAFSDENDADDAYVPVGKQRSMTPVMIALGLTALAHFTCQALNLISGTRILLAGLDYNAGRITAYELDEVLAQALAFQPPVDIIVPAFLATIVAFLWFNVRAVSNLRAFSQRHVPASPLGVVLWQFAPILNLVKPYSIMMMLWSRSKERAGEDPETPALGLWWWLTWVAGILFATLSRTLDYVDTERLLSTATEAIPLRSMWLAVVSTACYLISTLAMLAVTTGIARTQSHIRKRVSTVDVFS